MPVAGHRMADDLYAELIFILRILSDLAQGFGPHANQTTHCSARARA
jgi:hypothetical protein